MKNTVKRGIFNVDRHFVLAEVPGFTSIRWMLHPARQSTRVALHSRVQIQTQATQLKGPVCQSLRCPAKPDYGASNTAPGLPLHTEHFLIHTA